MAGKGPTESMIRKEEHVHLKTDPTAVYLIKKIDLTPETVDDIFINERDGEPFVVRYGLSREANHAIIFEKTGIDGMRFIALANPQEYGQQEYDDFLNGKTEPEFAPGGGGDFEEVELLKINLA